LSFDEKIIVSSTGALALPKVPKDLIVIGGGVIGLEMGSVYARFGSNVTVIEYLDEIVPSLDKEVAKNFNKILVKQGIKILTSHKVVSGKNHGTYG
jgi:dihydrolipoamide dehydrogenase